MPFKKSKLTDIVNQKNPIEIKKYVTRIFSYYYSNDDFYEVENCYEKIRQLFSGNFPGYKACNTKYHNFFHTLDAFLTTAILIDGFNIAKGVLSVDLAKNLLNASLLHDVGYIQDINDNNGTGAKYTQTHVLRSILFLSKNYNLLGIEHNHIVPISNLIECTELKSNLNNIDFSSEFEKVAGTILGTADILGQMSNRQYLERLLFLYYEFKEAGIPGYNKEYDIIKNTLHFYKEIKNRLDKIYNSVYVYAVFHFKERYKIEENLFITAIDNNINYIKEILKENTENYRKKLRRGNIVERKKILQ
jgi:hypothetical protein